VPEMLSSCAKHKIRKTHTNRSSFTLKQKVNKHSLIIDFAHLVTMATMKLNKPLLFTANSQITSQVD